MLLWLQRPPHHEGGMPHPAPSTRTGGFYLTQFSGAVQISRAGSSSSEAETWPPIASPVFWPIVFRLHPPSPH